MSGYAVVIEGEPGAHSAYSPDLPGCVAAADTREEVERLMREAVVLHIASLRGHGEDVPPPSAAGTSIIEV